LDEEPSSVKSGPLKGVQDVLEVASLQERQGASSEEDPLTVITLKTSWSIVHHLSLERYLICGYRVILRKKKPIFIHLTLIWNQ